MLLAYAQYEDETKMLLASSFHLHSNFRGGLWKTYMFRNRGHNGRSRSSKVTYFFHQSKAGIQLPIVINSNLEPNLTRFRDIAGFLLRTVTPPHSIRVLGCSIWTILPILWLRRAKTLSQLPKPITGVINCELVQPTCPRYLKVTDRQTDRRTNGQTTYNSHTALYTVCIARQKLNEKRKRN